MARRSNAWEGSTRWGNPKKPLGELDILSQYKRLAERADKRLQRLEKKFGTSGYEGLENWSYARAMRDIKSWSGPKGTRFKTAIPKFDNQAAQERYIKAKIADINRFLQADTSTVTGGIQSAGLTPLKKAAKTFSKNYKAKITWQEMGAYFESATAERVAKQFGSKTVAKALARFKRLANQGKNVEDEIKNNPRFRLSSDKLVAAAMQKMMDEGFSQDSLFHVKNKFEVAYDKANKSYQKSEKKVKKAIRKITGKGRRKKK